MICGHCQTPISFEWKTAKIIETSLAHTMGKVLAYAKCPACYKNIVAIQNAGLKLKEKRLTVARAYRTDIIYPQTYYHLSMEHVPHNLAKDYKEAKRTLVTSPQGSAMLARRILQSLLRDTYGLKNSSLAEEIKSFQQLEKIPAYIAEAVDAIRFIGNFGAHPSKDKETGVIIQVEKEEAEWLLELIEYLFDFTFIQPKKLEKRKEALNKKLKKMGKPAMRSLVDNNKSV